MRINLGDLIYESLLLEMPWFELKDGTKVDFGLEIGRNDKEKRFEVLYRFIKKKQELHTRPHNREFVFIFDDIKDKNIKDSLNRIMKYTVQSIGTGRAKQIALKVDKDDKNILVMDGGEDERGKKVREPSIKSIKG